MSGAIETQVPVQVSIGNFPPVDLRLHVSIPLNPIPTANGTDPWEKVAGTLATSIAQAISMRLTDPLFVQPEQIAVVGPDGRLTTQRVGGSGFGRWLQDCVEAVR